MLIEFKGGPCDGERVQLLGDPEEAFFLVASHHSDKPVYRCSICPCCAAKAGSSEIIDYTFFGYESRIKKTEFLDSTVTHGRPQESVDQ